MAHPYQWSSSRLIAFDKQEFGAMRPLFSMTSYAIIVVRLGLQPNVWNVDHAAASLLSTTPLRVRNMNKIELSIHLEANYPANKSSITQRKPIHGVGFNDADYAVRPVVNGVNLMDPAYRTWSNMLKRAYDQKLHERYPTYSDVTVCKEWHSFNAFRTWWLENYREGGHLDKDLLVVGNREYSPRSCLYIPQWLNKFTTDSGASRGELPVGVYLCKQTGKYKSQCCNPITGKNRNLGRFSTPKAAHEAWLTYKLALADQLKPQMDAIDQRIYPNVVTIIKAAV